MGNLVQETAPNIFNDIFKTSETLDIITLLNNFEVKNRFLGNAVIGFNGNITELQSKNNALLGDLRIELKKLD